MGQRPHLQELKLKFRKWNAFSYNSNGIVHVRTGKQSNLVLYRRVFLLNFLQQVAGNFASAIVIHHAPGYQHVPVPRLALLFCARPSLGLVYLPAVAV